MTETTTTRTVHDLPHEATRPLDCGHAPTRSEIGAGYAVDRDNRTSCYPCADDAQRAALLTTTTATTAYLSRDRRTVTTWTGGELMQVTAAWDRADVGFGGYLPARERGRTYVRATDVHGQTWHGSGPRSADYVTMRRSVTA